MKILFMRYFVNNLGGIIPWMEQLGWGFRDLGHEVDMKMAIWSTGLGSRTKDAPIEKLSADPNETLGAFNRYYNMYTGWSLNRDDYLCYAGKENMDRCLEIMSKYDLIIWTTPVPTKQKGNIGNIEWLRLYDSGVKQITVIHDGNSTRSYPWMHEIAPKLTAMACVHGAAFHAGANFPVFRSLIVNPQDMSNISLGLDYEKRKRGFLSLQNFKGWKRVDDLVRCIHHLPKDDFYKILAGGGLELSYMTTPDPNKVKGHYWVNKANDPDLAEEPAEPLRIWDHAEKHGMDFRGFINEAMRDKLLSKLRTLIDPSWSTRYASHGDHFNRVVIDAAKMGAIPVATNLGISSNLEGIGEVFKPNVNYIMTDYRMTPKQRAEVYEYASNLPNELAETIRHNNLELCKKFDRKLVAQQYLDLAEHKSNAEHCVLDTEEYIEVSGVGNTNPDVVRDSKYYMDNFFTPQPVPETTQAAA